MILHIGKNKTDYPSRMRSYQYVSEKGLKNHSDFCPKTDSMQRKEGRDTLEKEHGVNAGKEGRECLLNLFNDQE